jgi:hypothetical protein
MTPWCDDGDQHVLVRLEDRMPGLENPKGKPWQL